MTMALKQFLRATKDLNEKPITTTKSSKNISHLFKTTITNAPLPTDLLLPEPPAPTRARYEIVFPSGYNDVHIQNPSYKLLTSKKRSHLLPTLLVQYPSAKPKPTNPNLSLSSADAATL